MKPYSKRQFVHKMFVHNFCALLTPPPPNQQDEGFPLEFLLERPQTELRTLSQNCEQTLQKLRTNRIMNKRAFLKYDRLYAPWFWGRGSGGVKSAGVSQSVRETGRDESQSVPCPEKLFKTRDLELPIFEGSVPSCSPHSAGYTRTSAHPYVPVTNGFLWY